MPEITSTRPIESPPNPDPVSRLVEVLLADGFRPVHEEEGWQALGEKVYHRSEKILFAQGETVFILIDFPQLSDKVLEQAMRNIRNLFQARSGKEKALSVLQTVTIFVCIIAESGTPHYENLAKFISTAGGAVMVPVVIVPEINQVVYPHVDKRLSPVVSRLEYLRWALGERREPVEMHLPTVRAFWFSVGFATILAIFVLLTLL